MGSGPKDQELRERADDIAPAFLEALKFRKTNMSVMRTPAHWDVFAHFIQHDVVESVKTIALHAEIDAKTAKRILSEFEAAKIIRQISVEGDRRFKRFAITDEGLELMIAFWEILTGDNDLAN